MYLSIEDLNMVVPFSDLFNELIAEFIEGDIIALQFPAEISRVRRTYLLNLSCGHRWKCSLLVRLPAMATLSNLLKPRAARLVSACSR